MRLGDAALGNLLPAGVLQNNPYGYPYLPDNRPIRVRLNERLNSNKQIIASKEIENKEIEEALRILDEHPYAEKLSDVIRKVFG